MDRASWLASLKPGDTVAYRERSTRQGVAIATLTVARLTPTLIVTTDGLRFKRVDGHERPPYLDTYRHIAPVPLKEAPHAP